jgi:nucleoside-diphosphate-sugar epimerase
VALAGATGFVGRRLLGEMNGRGWRVRALVRKPADASALAREGLEAVLGDLGDVAALAQLVEGVDVTVDCAGLIKARTRNEFDAVNRDGAARLASAARGRVILISSLAAREPGLSDYAASKRAGEEACREMAGERLAIVRPPVIYGPGDRETLALFRLAKGAPLAPTPARPKARLALAHVDDTVSSILDVIERPDLSGTYGVGGDRPGGYAWSEILDTAWRAVGRAPAFAPIPAWAVGLAAIASEAGGAFRGSTPIFTRGKAREMLHDDWALRPEELAPDAPPARFSLAAGFADAVAWYRAQDWL